MPTGQRSPAAEADGRTPQARFAAALGRLNPQGGPIGLAVSGGPDSMAMLLLAHDAVPGGFRVATVDHGLRPEAAQECALVEAACAERDVNCTTLRVTVQPGNVQAAARRARYDALGRWAEENGLGAVATAHHADDQAETLLMRLNRGSGIAGLAGIRDRHEMPFAGNRPGASFRLIRPLLGFRYGELRALIERARAPFVSDPSNLDERFDRVRMRKALTQADWLDPAAVAASAGHLADALDALNHEKWQLYERCAIRDEENGQRVMRMTLPSDTPRYFALELVDVLIRNVGGDPRGGDVARLLGRLERGEGGNVAGVLVTVHGDEWLFRREPPRRGG